MPPMPNFPLCQKERERQENHEEVVDSDHGPLLPFPIPCAFWNSILDGDVTPERINCDPGHICGDWETAAGWQYAAGLSQQLVFL